MLDFWKPPTPNKSSKHLDCIMNNNSTKLSDSQVEAAKLQAPLKLKGHFEHIDCHRIAFGVVSEMIY